MEFIYPNNDDLVRGCILDNDGGKGSILKIEERNLISLDISKVTVVY